MSLNTVALNSQSNLLERLTDPIFTGDKKPKVRLEGYTHSEPVISNDGEQVEFSVCIENYRIELRTWIGNRHKPESIELYKPFGRFYLESGEFIESPRLDIDNIFLEVFEKCGTFKKLRVINDSLRAEREKKVAAIRASKATAY